jgi:aspartyl-tRNA synthetase
VIRQGVYIVQVAMFMNEKISKQMLKFVSSISKESIIDVHATVHKVDTPIESCTQKDVELQRIGILLDQFSVPKTRTHIVI